MIHPKTRLQYINDQIGYGVFAVECIPKGTIVYVKDCLEREVPPEAFGDLEPDLQQVVEKYSYIDERGVRIISWDFAKYVNHCCHCNTMSTGYGFEIALRDIQPGEQLTDEYGLFNLAWDMEVDCGVPGCRRRITNGDFDRYYRDWDRQVQEALQFLFEVEQPLLPLLDDATLEQLIDYLQDESAYRSVYALRYRSAGADNGVPAAQSARRLR